MRVEGTGVRPRHQMWWSVGDEGRDVGRSGGEWLTEGGSGGKSGARWGSVPGPQRGSRPGRRARKVRSWRDVRRGPRTPARRQGPSRPAVGVPDPPRRLLLPRVSATTAASTCSPASDFEAMARDADATRSAASEMTLTRQRALAHSATLVTLDKQGRVTLDEKLRSYARLEPELAGRRRPATSTAPRCGARSSTTTSPPPGAASWPEARSDAGHPHASPPRRKEERGPTSPRRRERHDRRLRAPAGDARRDRRRCSPPCRPGSCSTPRSAAAATPRPSSTAGTTCWSSASTATRAALAAATARLERFGDRFRAVHARFDDLHQIMPTDQIPRPPLDAIDAALQRRPERRAVRPRRVVAAARPGRARLLVPPRRTARHADGHRPRRGRRPTSSTATTRTSWRGSSGATATSASPRASPGRSSPPARSRRRPSWRRS